MIIKINVLTIVNSKDHRALLNLKVLMNKLTDMKRAMIKCKT